MISLISASLLMVGLLAGCGNEKEPSQPSAEQAQPQQTEEAQPSTEQPQAQAGIFQTMQMTDFDGNEVDKSLFEGHRFPEGKLMRISACWLSFYVRAKGCGSCRSSCIMFFTGSGAIRAGKIKTIFRECLRIS